ncbi:MAG: c-type cytochrome [Planctomycetota bacterium]
MAISFFDRVTFVAAWIVLSSAFHLSAQDAPAPPPETLVPAYTRFRSEHLQSAEAGRLLIAEMNCQSCHGPFPGLTVAPRQAPVLTAAAARLNPDHVRLFLANPQQQKPGTAMPAIPAATATPETLDALTAFVTAGSTWRPQAVSVDAIRRGEDLYHRVGCAACHGDQRSNETISAVRRGLAPPNPDEDDEPRDPTAAAVVRPDFLMPLGPLTEKYNSGGLMAFLREPHTVRPSGRMPSLGLSPDDARDIASYLLRDVKVEGSIQYEYFEGSWEKLPDFTALKPVSTGTTTDFAAGPAARGDDYALRFTGYLQIAAAGEYRFHVRSDDGSRVLIDEQEVVNNDGIHPPVGRDGVITLTAGSHAVVVEFFEKGGGEELAVEIEGPGLPRQPLSGSVTLTRDPPKPQEKKNPAPSPELIAKGRLLFAQLGCATCHQHGNGDQRVPSQPAVEAPVFAAMRPDSGCLSATVSRAPQFALSDRQRSDLQAAVATARQSAPVATPAADVRSVMLSLNCFACHARGGIGGPSEPLNHVFTGTIPEMGDEGRVPPPLDGAGDKLNEDWLRRILSEGAKDRPYMHTRMPAFGGQHADVLLPRLAADRQAEVPVPEFTEADHRIKADARLLIGDKALSCIKCHRFDNLAATGLQSLDMTTMTTRLRRDWFHRYLLDPQKYRPGTRMPAAWPGGNSIIPHVLEGDSARQIEAVWRYLLDGRRAKVPSGLERQSIVLTPEQRPLIYRNFIEGLSPRGIAVGFPEKVHFAWDAEHTTVRLIWHGAFIDAAKHWVDRGPGFQSPLGDHVMTLPAGPPIATLSSLDDAWPGGSPRELGYQFRGYRLSPAGLPSFRTSWKDLQLIDTLEPLDNTPDFGLKRTLDVASTTALRGLWLRIAAGKITEQPGGFVCDGVQYVVTGGLPIVREAGGRQELLVQLADGSPNAKVVVEIRW